MSDAQEFMPEKLHDVVHYVAQYVGGRYSAAALGLVKIHKILFATDFLAFMESGNSVTGSSYRRQQFGAGCCELPGALQSLAKDDRVVTTRVRYYGTSKLEFRSVVTFPEGRLRSVERELVIHVCDHVAGGKPAEFGDFDYQGLVSSVPIGSIIPYSHFPLWIPTDFTLSPS